MKKIVMALSMGIMLASCGSDSETEEETARELPQGNFTIESPVEFSDDPAEKQAQQESMVQSMLDDPSITLETIEGEAARRGVTLTDAQRAAKRVQQPPQENAALE